MVQELDKTKIQQKKPIHRFQPGVSGNPKGRPKGTVSLITEIKKHLKRHPEKVKELVQYYLTNEKMRDLLIRMIDGNPKQNIGLGVDNESLENLTSLFEKIFNIKD